VTATIPADDAPAELAERRSARRRSTAEVFRSSAGGSELDRRRVRDAAVVEFLDVADAVARRYIPRGHDGDDIRQVAYVGLVKAASRFDPDKGDDFVSFAVPTISGEIKRHLRDNGWFIRPPRHVQELRGRITAASPRLAQQLGRTPARRELADHLGVDVAALDEAARSGEGLMPASLDVAVSDDDALTLADTVGGADAGYAHVELSTDLRRALRDLAPRERRIVHLRFVEDRTQQQIADELHVTQMQVSRLIVKILARLRASLSGSPSTDAPVGAVRTRTPLGGTSVPVAAPVPRLRPRGRDPLELKSA